MNTPRTDDIVNAVAGTRWRREALAGLSRQLEQENGNLASGINSAIALLSKTRDGLQAIIEAGSSTLPEERAYAAIRDAIMVLEGKDLSKTIAFEDARK